MGNKASYVLFETDPPKTYRYRITPYPVLHRHTRQYAFPTKKNRSTKIGQS
jgi:hypothetical protein